MLLTIDKICSGGGILLIVEGSRSIMKKVKNKKRALLDVFNTEVVTDIYVFIMLLFFPLVIGINGYYDIDKVKLYFFMITTTIWLLSLIILFILERIHKKKLQFKINMSYVFIFIFLIISFISTLLSPYKPDVFFKIGRYEGFLTTLLYVLIFLGISLFTKPKRIFMWAMGIGVGLCSIVAFLQILDFNVLWLFPNNLSYYTYSKSFLGTIGNIDFLSAYLCLVLPILFIFSLKSDNKVDRLLLFPTLLGLTISLISRVSSGLLALSGCVLLTIPLLFKDNKKAIKAGIGVFILILIVGVGIFFYKGNNTTIHEISEVLHGRMSDEFGTGRGLIWNQGIDLFLEHPWLGTGPGSTSKRYHIKWYSLNTRITNYVDNAHNAYLGYLINIGVFGALSYILFLLSCLIKWINKRNINYFYIAIGSGVLCYLMQDFFNLNTYMTAPLLFIMLGLLISKEGKLKNE